MTAPAVIVLLILLAAFLLFITGWLKPDIIAMLVLVSLVLSGAIAPDEAFVGFSSFAVITIAGLMVIGEGLVRTGVVKWVAQKLEGIIRRRYGRLLMLNTAIPGLLSGFVNIVAAASFFIPVILRLSKQMKVPQSKILLPMACTALLGANLTLIGASHNLVVNSLLEEATGTGFGFFEFTVVGAVLLVSALVYIGTIGQRLLPGQRAAPQPTAVPETLGLAETYALEDRLFELFVTEEFKDKIRLSDINLEASGLIPVALVRENERLVLPRPEAELQARDMLLLQGRQSLIEALAEEHEPLTFVGSPKSQVKYPISTAELAEAVVPPRSPAIGKKIADLDLLDDFGMTAIAYYRDGRPYRTGIRDVELREGDGILIYGPREQMREFEPEKDLLIYFKPGAPEVSVKGKKMAPLSVSILLAAIVPAALGWMPIAATAVAGAVLMVLFGIVKPQGVYRVIDWRTLVLIGGMYPLGIALNQTGAANLIGEGLVGTLGDFGPLAVLGGVAGLSMVLTQPIHNAAVAVIMTPIAINAATMMDSSPKAFCIGVIVACSATFLMPYGHPAPFMVQEPGGYSGRDYLRFGIALNLIVLAVILGLIPLLWPL